LLRHAGRALRDGCIVGVSVRRQCELLLDEDDDVVGLITGGSDDG
jgi:hypothetical protein